MYVNLIEVVMWCDVMCECLLLLSVDTAGVSVSQSQTSQQLLLLLAIDL